MIKPHMSLTEKIEIFRATYQGNMRDGYQRRGQAYFNALSEVDPFLANQLRATEHDPFYNDDRILAFLATVYEIWGGYQ